MSKTAETEIPTFFFWLWPASAADMGTVRKNKLFTKIDAKMIKYYIVKTKVEYQFFVDHIIFEPYFLHLGKKLNLKHHELKSCFIYLEVSV